MNGHAVANVLLNSRAEICLDGQFVRTVAEGHKRALERHSIDCALNFDKTSCLEVLRRAGQDYVRPPALIWASLKHRDERLVQMAHDSA